MNDVNYIGPPADLPTKQQEWMARYVIRMTELGVDAETAWACCHAGASDHDYDADPREAAEDEVSYWDADDEA